MRLRVFISSTMKDMANERDSVYRKLEEFGMEPVNAEGWLPDGATSWERIAEELRSCDLFVLLSGETYGWTPSNGPGAEKKVSVTELEYLEARKEGIPVLPFLKKLPYHTGPRSSDVRKRDAFRKRIMEWETGYFVVEFTLASDLAIKVGRALIGVIAREFKTRVQERVAAKRALSQQIVEQAPPSAGLPSLPEALIGDILQRRAVLLAGAGMSISAGLPTAPAFAEYLKECVREIAPGYSDAALPFASVASDFEAIASRQLLIEKLRDLLHPPQGLEETSAHRSATHAFDVILTTNWDNLFEQALSSQGDERPLIAADVSSPIPARALIKLHGSLDDPSSPLVTETDISRMDHVRAGLWAETCRLLRERTIVVVGTSLRDPSIVRLMEEVAPVNPGYFVAPIIDSATKARLARWNLIPIEATANDFFAVISKFLGVKPK